MWQARGWLIMMRARHQGCLARPEGRLARFRQCVQSPQKLKYSSETLISNSMTASDGVLLGNLSTSEVELEAGSSNGNLVQAVLMVVEIEEEGLFRHVITYL